MNPKEISLALFLTRNVPMEVWHRIGTLERETSYYVHLASILREIDFITYGDNREFDFAPKAVNIQILINRRQISPNLYSVFSPLLHRKTLAQVDVYKTNQLDGAWSAIIGGWLFRKPVIVRAGYIWSDFFRQEVGHGFKASLVEFLERRVLNNSSRVFVTTHEIKNRYIEKYHLPSGKFVVIPNFIDTHVFYPNPKIARIKGRICVVTRLDPIKNIEFLVRAVARIPGASLCIIGQGKQYEYLNQLSEQLHANVEFLGQLPNDKLPSEIWKSDIFVLPSTLEGHPKALLEAMACGCPVIGSDVPGIRDLIKDDQTGLLCEPTIDSIFNTIHRLLGDEELRIKLGTNAAEHIHNTYSMEMIAALEIDAIMECVATYTHFER